MGEGKAGHSGRPPSCDKRTHKAPNASDAFHSEVSVSEGTVVVEVLGMGRGGAKQRGVM